VSRYIYGIHEPNPLVYQGWVVHTVAVGHDPHDGHGWDFRERGKTALVRVNHGYGRAGTIPRPPLYEAFAQRCANVAAASEGCSRWIIGNEMNHSQERPEGQAITPWMYGECFSGCRAAIRAVPGHEADDVIVGAVAPWNAETRYAENLSGDWIRYFQDVLQACRAYDGVAVHTYSRSQWADVVASEARMGSFPEHNAEFRSYRDFARVCPEGTPIYITETNPCAGGTVWVDENRGWVRAAYAEIAAWNASNPTRQIRCLSLYRWPRYDRWYIEGKGGVIEDYMAAVKEGYTWGGEPGQPPEQSELAAALAVVAEALRGVADVLEVVE